MLMIMYHLKCIYCLAKINKENNSFSLFFSFFNRMGDGNKRNVYRVRFFPLKAHVTFSKMLIFEVL